MNDSIKRRIWKSILGKVAIANGKTITEELDHTTDVREVLLLGNIDDLLGQGLKLLGLRHRRDDALVIDQALNHVTRHRLAVGRLDSELSTSLAVTHGFPT